MRKSKFTEEQMAYALKQAELGISVEEVCRKMGISSATFYKWRQKYAGVGPSELRRMRQLEEENRKLKQIVADLSLDKAMLQDVAKKSGTSRREAAGRELFDRSLESELRRACRVIAQPPSTHRYTSSKDPRNDLRQRMREIAQTRVRYGYPRGLGCRSRHPATRRARRRRAQSARTSVRCAEVRVRGQRQRIHREIDGHVGLPPWRSARLQPTGQTGG